MQIVVDAPMWQVALTFGLTVISVWLAMKGLSALWSYALGAAQSRPPTDDDAEFTPAQGLRIAASPDYLVSPHADTDAKLDALVDEGLRLGLIPTSSGRHHAGPGRPSVSDGLADLAGLRLPVYQVQSGELNESAASDDADLTDAEFHLSPPTPITGRGLFAFDRAPIGAFHHWPFTSHESGHFGEQSN